MKAESAAVVTVLQSAGVPQVFPMGSVPAGTEFPYAVVTVDNGTPGSLRLSAQSGTRRTLVAVQCFGSTFNECARTCERVDGALLETVLTLPGNPTRLQTVVATMPDRDPDDDGVIGATLTYSFSTAT